MITTTYTCDRCSAAVVPRALHRVTIRIDDMTSYTTSTDWCDECVRLTGLWPIHDKMRKEREAQGKAIPEPLTFEQLVREIIREEVQSADSRG